MLKHAVPTFLLLSACAPDICWDDCPVYDGPPPSASTSVEAGDTIAWEVLEGHLAWGRHDALFVADAARRRLTRVGYGFASFWPGTVALSPDATRLAFAAILHFDWEYRPFVVDTRGGKTEPLKQPGMYQVSGVARAPDASLLYVTSPGFVGDEQRSVHAVAADGSASTTLPLEGWQGSVAVSPDGLWLAGSSATGIVLAASDGSAVRALSTAPAGRAEYGPAWSPDGTQLAFVSRRGPNESQGSEHLFEIIVIEPERERRESVLEIPFENDSCDTFLTWSPSGTKLAYNRCSLAEDGGTQLHVLDLESGETRAVTSGDVFDGAPSWLP